MTDVTGKYSHLRIEFHSSCNLACSYCRSHSGKEYANAHGRITKDRIFSLIDEAKRLGFEIVVLKGGGEPFLREDIFDVINYGNLPKVVLTNGTILTEKVVRKLRNSDLLSYIKISLDGFESQKKLRGQHTLDLIKKGINYLDKYEVPYAINTVLTDNNLDELWDLYSFIASSKAFSWGVYPLIQQGRTIGSGLSSPVPSETAKVAARIISHYIEHDSPFHLEIEDFFVSDLLEDWADTTIISRLNEHPCSYQLSAITVRLNGDVSQCSRLQEQFGNIYESSLEEVLLGVERQSFLKRTIADVPACTNCKYAFICSAGCMGRKQLLGINPDQSDPVACEHARAFEKFVLPVLPQNIKERIINSFQYDNITDV